MSWSSTVAKKALLPSQELLLALPTIPQHKCIQIRFHREHRSCQGLRKITVEESAEMRADRS